MSTTRHRACVVTTAFAWFMVGLHVPAFHALEHGGSVPNAVMVATALLVVLAVATTVALLRRHAAAPAPSSH